MTTIIRDSLNPAHLMAQCLNELRFDIRPKINQI
jgi:hypothetical protein